MGPCLAVVFTDPLGIAVGPWCIQCDFKFGVIATGFTTHFLELAELGCQGFRCEPQRRPAITDRDRITQRPIHIRSNSAGADMNRRMGLAGGLRITFYRREFNELALETSRWLYP